MTDRAVPNLPARDFGATEAFYADLGFVQVYRDAGWMILGAGSVTLEFFPFPELDPAASSFSACLRLDHLDALVARVEAAGVPLAAKGFPRFHPPQVEPWGGRIAYLVDPDGTLLRLIDNRSLGEA
ncbi:bleomycin resistance protein [Sphingomonas sp. Y38-1Y]|uniref:bleomycin resistance protein n=1 Tax=Sphingomonas sp. Y38-1Y TaxID=3078265 RepID=UPI0028E18CDF|nr:bleomycin resistance protein [Sphingomonas sp. Y38-1Y]